jgi:16S rRNA (uracil1498-N3)-methyltransferase
MSAPTFYHPEKLAPGSVVTLSGEESRHAVASRRLGKGDSVRVINGQAEFSTGVIDSIDERGLVSLVLGESGIEEVPNRLLEIASALPKGGRVKVMLDMLNQLGVTRFTALDCEHSETRYRRSMQQKWERVIIESAKQCGRARFIQVSAGDPLKFATDRLREDAVVVICDREGKDQYSVRKVLESTGSAAFLIGPEGGFSPDELHALTSIGCHRLRLPGHILRTETAAIVVAAMFSNTKI